MVAFMLAEFGCRLLADNPLWLYAGRAVGRSAAAHQPPEYFMRVLGGAFHGLAGHHRLNPSQAQLGGIV